MANPYAHFPLYLLSLSLLLPLSSSHTTPPLETFIHGGCSPTLYATSSPFSSNLNTLLTSLLNSSTHSPFTHLSSNDVVQGLYQCRGDLPASTCTACVARAASLLASTCPLASGAAVQLHGCYLRYGANASFWGVEDKNVVFKRFGGPPIGLDKEKMVARAEVLNGLVRRGNRPYRFVGSRGVVGRAQCMGDLSTDRCQGCVEAAVKLLRTEYGSSGHGDMFLAKCYARYSCSGAGGGHSNSGSSNEGVKTFALIAGSLAGIVVLIVFLTFICREFAGSDK